MNLAPKIRNLVGKGATDEALIELNRFAEKHRSSKDVILLQAQFSHYQKNKILNLHEDDKVFARINFAILTITENIESDLKEATNDNKKTKTPNAQYKGKIIKLFTENQYGFIESDKYKNNIFFHFSSLKSLTNLKISSEVMFFPRDNPKGVFSVKTIIVSSNKNSGQVKTVDLSRSKSNKPNLLPTNNTGTLTKIAKEVEKDIVKLFKKIIK